MHPPRPLRHFFDRSRTRVRQLRGREIDVRPTRRCALVWLGSGEGEWSVSRDHLRRGALVYSFGVGMDISFDLDLIRGFGAEVHAFDPTPISKAWLAKQTLPTAFHFHDYGLGEEDGELQFSLPEKHWVSFTPLAATPQTIKQTATGRVRRLDQILRELGHGRVDVLKLDIEGGEYGLIPTLVAHRGAIGQLLIEFHHRLLDRPDAMAYTVEAIRALERGGFELFNVSPSALEFSFVTAPG